MAVTFAVAAVAPLAKAPQAAGQLRSGIFDVTATGTYTDGGDSLTAGAFGLQKIVYFRAELNQTVTTAGSAAGFMPVYDYTNSKLKFFKANGTTNILEASGATVTSATAFKAHVVGI